MISTTRLLLFGCLGVVAMIALPTMAGTNKVADMQLNFWKEKLPNIPVPDTVAASLSPLTEEEANKYAKIIKGGNLQSYANQFCKSANLLCLQPIEVVAPILSWSRSPNGETSLSNSDLFFSLKQLMERGQVTLPKLYSPWKSFLPSNLSELMPFSTAALSDVLSSFGILERSNMAVDMNMTLAASEAKLPEDEIGKATTSIEGMIEYVLSNFGSSQSLELVSHPQPTADVGKKARIRNVVQRLSGTSDRPSPLGCHRLVYPYGVYYCHFIARTMAFNVQFEVVNNGNIYNATVLCHLRGAAPTQESTDCHLIVGDTLLWFTKDNR